MFHDPAVGTTRRRLPPTCLAVNKFIREPSPVLQKAFESTPSGHIILYLVIPAFFTAVISLAFESGLGHAVAFMGGEEFPECASGVWRQASAAAAAKRAAPRVWLRRVRTGKMTKTSWSRQTERL